MLVYPGADFRQSTSRARIRARRGNAGGYAVDRSRCLPAPHPAELVRGQRRSGPLSRHGETTRGRGRGASAKGLASMPQDQDPPRLAALSDVVHRSTPRGLTALHELSRSPGRLVLASRGLAGRARCENALAAHDGPGARKKNWNELWQIEAMGRGRRGREGRKRAAGGRRTGASIPCNVAVRSLILGRWSQFSVTFQEPKRFELFDRALDPIG